MDSTATENNTLDQLIDQAENDNSRLYEMATTFIYLMASSDIEFINKYNERVGRVINRWRNSYRTANAMYHLVTGYSLFFLSRPQEGLEEMEILFEHCDDTSLFDGIKGAGYMGRAVCNRSIGRIDKTMEDCLKGIELIQPKNTPEVWHIYIFRMMGEIHTFIGELDEAIVYYLKAKSVMESINSTAITTARFRVYDALGNCHQEMGKMEEAEGYLMAAMEIENLSKAEKARVLCDMGILYLAEPSKALKYFEESCSIRSEADLMDAYTTSLIYVAECQIKLKEAAKAEVVLNEAMELVDKYNVPSKRLHMYRQYIALNEYKGDYQQANRYFRLYDDLKIQIQIEQNKNIFQIKNRHR